MTSVALYLRVSTQDQDLGLQRSELEKYASSRGYTNLLVYEDKASGTNTKRPAFQRLLRDVRERKVDLILCWKFDRLFRSLRDLVIHLQEFSELGVEFISLKDNVDLSTSAGKLMLHMVGAFAEFEASIIRERVRAGIENARAKGKRLGRPKKRDDKKIEVLRSSGCSIRKIATALGIFKGAVQRSLASTQKV